MIKSSSAATLENEITNTILFRENARFNLNSYSDHLQRRIYQYQSANANNLEALCSGRIWLSYPRTFNDPYDCDINIKDDLSESVSDQGHNVEELKRLIGRNYSGGHDGSWNADLLSLDLAKKIVSWSKSEVASGELKEAIKNHYKNNIGVRCFFSEEPKSVQMWAHYSADHTGFCVKYRDTKGHTAPVTYISAPHTVYLSELLFTLRNMTNLFLLSKDASWTQERERRLIKRWEATDVHPNGFLVPVTELSLIIETIYVGYACNEDSIKKIVKYSAENKIEVLRCTKGQLGCRFDFENIPL